MDEAPEGNPYAAPAAPLADVGPPSRLALTCAAVLHGFWWAWSALTVVNLFAVGSARSRLLPCAALAFTILYAFTIWQLFRRRRWAWWVGWMPIIAMLIFGVGTTISYFYMDAQRQQTFPLLPLFAIVLGPAVALVPLQWLARREL